MQHRVLWSEHYGFAQPWLGIAFLALACGVLCRPLWVMTLTGLGLCLLVCGGEQLARYRALQQVRRWAAWQGVKSVVRYPRGGFVSWGWSVWSFAEMDYYRGVTADGKEQHMLASYLAPAFGLVVFTYCEMVARQANSQLEDKENQKTG
jgi:hypothetical protein